MIVVRVELHSAVTGLVKEIGKMYVGNDGTGSGCKMHYDAKVLRRAEKVVERDNEIPLWPDAPVTRTGRVENYPASSYNVWRLISRALLSAFPEEKT